MANTSTSQDGLMLGLGFGYNWDSVSLDSWINIKDSSDYEDNQVNIFFYSSGIGISFRF